MSKFWRRRLSGLGVGSAGLIGLVVAGGLGLAAVMTGCVSKGAAGSGPGDAGGAAGGYWQVEPTQMRIYPSSRFSTVDGLPVLEARLELTDAAGDPVKGVGDLRFELHSGGGNAGRQPLRKLYDWDIAMHSLVDNRKHYDPVTRSYLFILSMRESVHRGRNVTLRCTMTRPDGARLTAECVFNDGEMLSDNQ